MSDPITALDKRSVRLVAKLLRSRGRRPQRIPRKRQSIPKHFDAAYFARLRRLIAAMRASIQIVVIPQLDAILSEVPANIRRDSKEYHDTFAERAAKAVREARILFEEHNTIERDARSMAGEVERFNGERIRENVSAVLGVRPELHEPWLDAHMRGFVQKQVRLVRDVSDQFYDRAENSIIDGILQGSSAKELASDLIDDFVQTDGLEVKRGEKRAALIARDQLSSYNGELTKVRQQELGIERYEWSTSHDERVRPSHKERDGKIFNWDEPIEDQLEKMGLDVDGIEGPPGMPINCRCVALPVLQDLLDEEGGADVEQAEE